MERTEEELKAIGESLINMLNLKVKKNGRVDTSWGDKTPLGLALSVKRVLDGE